MTFTIDGATNTGFLAVTPGDSATFEASTINWSITTPTLATSALADRRRPHAQDLRRRHRHDPFLVDITGYR